MFTLLHDHAVLATECIKNKKELKKTIKEIADPHKNEYPYYLIEIT